jgi:hypothetical protein
MKGERRDEKEKIKRTLDLAIFVQISDTRCKVTCY